MIRSKERARINKYKIGNKIGKNEINVIEKNQHEYHSLGRPSLRRFA